MNTTLTTPESLLTQLSTDQAGYGDQYTDRLFEESTLAELAEAVDSIYGSHTIIGAQEIIEFRELTADIIKPDSPPRLMVTIGGCVGKMAVNEHLSNINNFSQIVNRAHTKISKKLGIKALEPIQIYRGLNFEKPRTKLKRKVKNKENDATIYEYCGPAINNAKPEPSERLPRPANLAGAHALTSKVIKQARSNQATHGIYFAREALVIPRLEAETRSDKTTDYNCSTEILWLGNRTRYEGSPQEEYLSTVENHIQVKIDATTTSEEIKRIANKLNPKNEPGKLGFILRLGVEKLSTLPEILGAVKEHAPGSLIITDPMHGNTYTDEQTGQKTRSLEDIKTEILAVFAECQLLELRVHGIHLEAINTNDKLECVDSRLYTPTHVSEVDPQLNIKQLEKILNLFFNLGYRQQW